MKHDIPEWYIPDEEVVLANEHEQEQIEERGELEEPLCPHCGKPYKKEDNGFYTHNYVRKDVGGRFETKEVWKPGVICTPSGDKRTENGFFDADTADIL